MAAGGLQLRHVAGLTAPDLRPPTVAEAGDAFAALRVAHLVCRLPRGVRLRLRDVVDRLNADHLDWSFSRPVVVAAVVQLQANWLADYRTEQGFELTDGPAGEEVLIEDSARIEPWLVRQVERLAAECRSRLSDFARDEGAIA